MLRVDATIDRLTATSEQVVRLFESINQPLLNIPAAGTAPTAAFVVGLRTDSGLYTVFVYLFQSETRGRLMYASDPRELGFASFQAEVGEACHFVESMGFMLEDTHFATLPPHEQSKVMARVPAFRASPETQDLMEVSDEQVEGADFSVGLFGGLDESDEELIRRAGFKASTPPPQRRIVGSPSGIPTVQGRLTSAPSSRPGRSPGTEGGRADRGALERLGRLLASFIVLVGICVASQGCRSPRSVGQIETQIDLGTQQLAQARWADAILAFSAALEDAPSNRDALRGLGFAYLNLGRLDDAAGYYREAIEAAPSWSVPKNELAIVLLERGRCDEAETLLEEVLEDIFYETPQFAEHNMARVLVCKGDEMGAIARLESLVERQPYFCLGYLTLADLASGAAQHESTISACEGFQRNCENHEEIRQQVLPQQSAMCYWKKGRAYVALGDIESARSSFRRCAQVGELGDACRRSLRQLPP